MLLQYYLLKGLECEKSQVILTANKGVAMVVFNKQDHIKKWRTY